MRSLSLEDIKPTTAKFKIQAMLDEELEILPLSVLDKRWMRETFTADELEKMFKENDFEKIGRIVFHQLSQEHKQLFKKQTVTIVNEEGDEAKVELGGLNLFLSLVRGINEQVMIIRALAQTFGISQNLLDLIAKEELESQKKNELIGQESSISSQLSMDGPQIRS